MSLGQTMEASREVKNMKEELKKAFIAGYKAMFDELITSPWDEDFALRRFKIWWEKYNKHENNSKK